MDYKSVEQIHGQWMAYIIDTNQWNWWFRYSNSVPICAFISNFFQFHFNCAFIPMVQFFPALTLAVTFTSAHCPVRIWFRFGQYNGKGEIKSRVCRRYHWSVTSVKILTLNSPSNCKFLKKENENRSSAESFDGLSIIGAREWNWFFIKLNATVLKS